MITRAAVLHGRQNVSIETFELSRRGDDDGLLRVEATGVCGTDIAAYNGEFNEYAVPRVLGHEMIGTVHEIGPDASARWGVEPGDRIAVEEYLPCGTCRSCLAGAYTICKVPKYGSRRTAETPAVWGSFADFMYLSPQSIVHKVPENVSPIVGQLYIPIANGLNWVQDVAQLRAGGTIVILGPGAHGLGSVIAAKETGADRIILVGLESDAYRLAIGKALGATDIVPLVQDEEVVEYVRTATNGLMADAVINLAPAPTALGLSIAVAGERGRIVHGAIGGQSPSQEIPADQILRKTLTVTGVRGRPSSASRAALKVMASERYPLELLNTHAYPLERVVDALEAPRRERDVVRAVVKSDETPFVPQTLSERDLSGLKGV